MPAQGNITLASKVFAPRGKTGDVATWLYREEGTLGGGNHTLTESVRGPQPKSGGTRIQFKLVVDKKSSVDSACACAGEVLGTAIAEIPIFIPPCFTDAERDVFRQMLVSLVSTAPFTAAVTSGEGSW